MYRDICENIRNVISLLLSRENHYIETCNTENPYQLVDVTSFIDGSKDA